MILEGLKSKYEEYHGVKYSKSAITSAVELSKKYINDRFLPDCAIDVIDEVGLLKNFISNWIENKNDKNIIITSKDVESTIAKWHIFLKEVQKIWFNTFKILEKICKKEFWTR